MLQYSVVCYVVFCYGMLHSMMLPYVVLLPDNKLFGDHPVNWLPGKQ